jgi:transposase-like protein
MTLNDVYRMFSSDDKCRELLKRLRWPEGPRCVRCGNTDVFKLATAKDLLYCRECRYQFTVTSGTIFHDSHLPLVNWFATTYLMCESRKGISANQIKRMFNISYKTAWYLCHRIRKAMAGAHKPMLDGTVEMDETYIGGKNRGRGREAKFENKEIVIGIRQRGGDLRFFHAEDVKSGTLAKYVKEHISQDVDVIVTDDFQAYPFAFKRAGQDVAKHKKVNHSAKEYVRKEDGFCVTTNTVESAFSLLKRGILGTWHKISAKHLQAYLEEMTFRFNRRKNDDLWLDTLRHMVTADPLTFERLTAEPDPEFDTVNA